MIIIEAWTISEENNSGDDDDTPYVLPESYPNEEEDDQVYGIIDIEELLVVNTPRHYINFL